jgi:CheY-like chemotaxis protein
VISPAPNSPAPDALILIVEDNDANLLLVRAVLTRAGYRTAEARSAEEAVEQLRTLRPDLILVDIGLPGQDGLSLTRQLKADPATAAIPVVAVTAHAMRDDQARALAAGCDGYVTKPIDTRALAGHLAAVLERHRAGNNTSDNTGEKE